LYLLIVMANLSASTTATTTPSSRRGVAQMKASQTAAHGPAAAMNKFAATHYIRRRISECRVRGFSRCQLRRRWRSKSCFRLHSRLLMWTTLGLLLISRLFGARVIALVVTRVVFWFGVSIGTAEFFCFFSAVVPFTSCSSPCCFTSRTSIRATSPSASFPLAPSESSCLASIANRVNLVDFMPTLHFLANVAAVFGHQNHVLLPWLPMFGPR